MNRPFAIAKPGLARRSKNAGGFGNPPRVPISAKWVVFLAIAAGGCSSSGGGDEPISLWFAVSQGPKSLLVDVDNSFLFLVDPDPGYVPPADAFPGLPERPRPDSGIDPDAKPGMVKRGQLDEATVSALRGYFTDEKIRHYIESSHSYTEDCRQHGITIDWNRPSGLFGCWYPAEVSDPATSEMLQYVGNLFESIANG
jgi:hypothetical protein